MKMKRVDGEGGRDQWRLIAIDGLIAIDEEEEDAGWCSIIQSSKEWLFNSCYPSFS